MRRPTPPQNAQPCPTCGGHGHFFIPGDSMKRHCYNCGGRGWVTPEFNRRFSPHPEANDHPSNPHVRGAKVNGRFLEGIH